MSTESMGGRWTTGTWRVEERDRWPGNSPMCPVREIMRDVEFVPGKVTTYKLAEVHYPTSGSDTVGAIERLANARLIAAAPDLAAALLVLLKVAGEIVPVEMGGLPSENEAIAQARAALARAGAQP